MTPPSDHQGIATATSAGRKYESSLEVTSEKVREFAAAIGDHNPMYVDADVARTHGHVDAVAPPTFAIMPAMRLTELILDDLEVERAQVVHVSQRFTYTRAIAVGDRLEICAILDSVRPVAGNDLLTVVSVIQGESGDHICTATSTLLVKP